METKDQLRQKAKEIRKSLNISYLSKFFCQKIFEFTYYKNSKNIMIYYPLKHELNFLELTKLNPEKNFYLPKVNGENLLVCPYDNCTQLKCSKMNILEPCSNPISPTELDLIIIPALLIDKKNYRLGYGGGFYDKFIAKFEGNFKTLCAIPKELIIESLPVEKFDKKIDYILTN